MFHPHILLSRSITTIDNLGATRYVYPQSHRDMKFLTARSLPRFLMSCMVAITCFTSRAQVTWYSDMFNGGVLTGGFSVGTVGQGSGSFTMPVPVGSTIHRAFFFGTQVGTTTPPVTVQLNGTPYTFDASNFVGPVFQSLYGGDAGVHAIDVTADLSAAVTNYTITVPAQVNSVSDVYTEFYLMIAYTLAGAQTVNVDLYFSDQDSQQTLNYTLNTSAQMFNTSQIGFCALGGYAACCTDCETVTANGTTLGSWFGGDFNSVDPTWGSMGALAYSNGVLTGLGDDNSDQAINGTDVVSDLSGLVANGATSVNVQFDHCAGGSPNDNHVWLMMLVYTSDQCDITLNLGPDTAFCTGGSLLLDATQIGIAANYTWQNGSTASTFNVVQTGDYYVHVNSALCDRYDTVHVDVNPPPVFNLGNDATICAGTPLTLDATSVPAGIITWQDGSGNTTFNVITTGIYWASVNNVGCITSDTVNITVLSSPVILLPMQANLCMGDTLVLNSGNPNDAHQWNTGETTQSIAVTTGGMYIATVTNIGGCSTTDTAQVTLNQYPVFNLGNDTIVCAGFSLTLDATSIPPGNITWQNGTTNNTYTATLGGPFWATVNNAGCIRSDTILITALPIPQTVLPPQVDICIGNSITLNAGTANASHLWNTGDTTQSITVNTGGAYSVIITNAGGCSTMDTTQVIIHLPPVVQLGPDTSLCLGEQWTMDAGNAGSTYLWNTGANVQALTISTSQVMWVHVTSPFGCMNGDTISVTFDPIPVINLQDDSVCISHTVTLNAGNPGAYYHWNTGATTQSIQVSGTGGVFSVVVTSPTFCTDSAQATITFIDFPGADLGPDTALCVNDVFTAYEIAPGMSLTWSNGTHNESIDVVGTGPIWVDVNNGFCTSRDSMNVLFNALPDPIAEATRTACLSYPPNMTPLDAGNAGSTFLWNTHDTTQVLQATAYAHYIVTITNPEHCTLTDTIEVVEYCPPQLWVPNSFTPDGDGFNDVFGPNGYNIATIDLSIFDRWGELIHTGEGTNANWDGSTGGTRAKEDVYMWKVHYRNVEDAQGSIGSVHEAVGHVTLLR